MTSESNQSDPRSKIQTIDGMLQELVAHGCTELSSEMDPDGYSKHPKNGGGYGDIYRGKMRDGRDVAVKVWRRFLNADHSKAMKRSMREIYHWSKLKHENIHELMGVTKLHGQLGMVSLWMEHGDLGSYISKNPEIDRNPLCLQVTAGVSYLHQNEVIHGDLKASNILVSLGRTAKISDFDCSLVSDGSLTFSATGEPRHTLRWAAPELLNDDDEDGIITKTQQSDIYALGMTLLEIKTGRLPYAEYNDHNRVLSALLRKKHPKQPDDLSNTLWDILVQCWDYDPTARPDAQEVLELLQVELEPVGVEDPVPIEISRRMSIQDMFGHLLRRGCVDLSRQMNNEKDPVLARGASGNTWEWELMDGSRVAIKTWHSYLTEEMDYKALKGAIREVYHWSKLKHDHVLQLMGVILFRDQHLGMVSQWMENGSLSEYIKSNPDANRYQLCLHIASGLAYIHSQDVVHGDLKSLNVLVSFEGVAKLREFSLSTMPENSIAFSEDSGAHSAVSLRWTAPEILSEGSPKSKSADVYALGMTMLEIFTGNVPYSQHTSDVRVMMEVLRGALPARPIELKTKRRDDQMWELLVSCWDHEPGERPSATEIFKSVRDMVENEGSNDTLIHSISSISTS